MPVAKARRSSTPFAAVFCDVQDRIDHLKMTDRDVATLYRQKWLDATELGRVIAMPQRMADSVKRP
jgi:CRISPR/Cas system type I-B associated protein Csh2 (Cas7 group RAMP superfamily)